MDETENNATPTKKKETISVDLGGLLQALRTGDQQAIDHNLGDLLELEDNVMSGIYFMRHGHDYYQRLMGFQTLAGFYRNRGELITSIKLAYALFEVLEQDEVVLSREREDVNMMAANVLDLLASNLAAVGHACSVVDDAERWAKWITKTGMEDYYLAQIRLCQAEALIMAGEYDQARECLQLLKGLKLKKSQGPILARLVNKLPVMLRAMDEAAPPPLDFNNILTQSLEVLADLLPGLKSTSKIGFKAVENAAVGLGFTKPAISVDGIIKQCHELSKSGNPQGTLIGLTSGLAEFIQDEQQGHDKEKLNALIEPLSLAQGYAAQYEFWEDWVTLSWLWSILLIRTDQLELAATMLGELRDEINRRRVAVIDPRNRAGVSVYLPHLYTQSAKVLFQLGPEYDHEYFHVIEEAKSKILAEVIGIRSEIGRTTTFEQFRKFEAEIFEELVQVLQNSVAQAQYVTTLINDDYTYFAIVNEKGEVQKERISLKAKTIRDTAHRLRELCNGSYTNLSLSRPIDPDDPWRRPFDPVVEAMQPFSDILIDYAKQVDVLCISLDDALFNIPIAMLGSKEATLLDLVPVTIVPSVDILIHCAKQRQRVSDYSQAIAYSIPQHNQQGDNEQEAFSNITETLRNIMPTIERDRKQASFEQFTEDAQQGQIILIAGHGKFNPKDPINDSGIYLSKNGESSNTSKYQVELITPSQMASLNISGSHLDLLACVSGETTAITSREALGMIWAMFQAGSSSINASAWKVNIDSAKELVKTFYYYWLKEIMLLYQAHQRMMQEIRLNSETWQHPYHWAPFVMYGYWE